MQSAKCYDYVESQQRVSDWNCTIVADANDENSNEDQKCADEYLRADFILEYKPQKSEVKRQSPDHSQDVRQSRYSDLLHQNSKKVSTNQKQRNEEYQPVYAVIFPLCLDQFFSKKVKDEALHDDYWYDPETKLTYSKGFQIDVQDKAFLGHKSNDMKVCL